MKTKNTIYCLFILACVWTLSACTSIRYPDLDMYESYQIANTSSSDVTLCFYEADTLKTIYAGIFDGPFVRNLNPKNAVVSCETLWSGNELTLTPGQTALFYYCNDNYQMTAVPLQRCGREGLSLRLFNYYWWFIGKYTTVSQNGAPFEAIPLQDGELWETWYDEKNFIYYHFWRIE